MFIPVAILTLGSICESGTMKMMMMASLKPRLQPLPANVGRTLEKQWTDVLWIQRKAFGWSCRNNGRALKWC